MNSTCKQGAAVIALVGAVALAVPALAQNHAGSANRSMMDSAGMMASGGMGHMMGGNMDRDAMAEGCGRMMQSMQNDGYSGRPNQQWRHPAPGRDHG